MGIGQWWNNNVATPIGNYTAPARQAIGETTTKVVYAVQNPIEAATVVAKATSQVVSGQEVTRFNITPEKLAASDLTLGDAVAFVPALYTGAASGVAGGTIAAALPAGEIRETVAAHPIATTAVVAATILAPAAIIYGGTALGKGAVPNVDFDGQTERGEAASPARKKQSKHRKAKRKKSRKRPAKRSVPRRKKRPARKSNRRKKSKRRR